MPEFNIDNHEVVELANKLEKIHKSAMPVAVRQTLNDVAFQSKKDVLITFADQFTERKKGFVRSHTSVNKSVNTLDINKMSSEMGVIKGRSEAGDELRFQELGGTISGRDYIPMDTARTGGSANKLISKRNYLNSIRGSRKIPAFKQQSFIKAAIKAGSGGGVIFNDTLFGIRTINKRGRNKLFIKSIPLYSYKNGRTVTLDKSPFLAPAGEMAYKQIHWIFEKHALKRFEKALK